MTSSVDTYTNKIIELLEKGQQADEILITLLRTYAAGKWGLFTCRRHHKAFCDRLLMNVTKTPDELIASDPIAKEIFKSEQPRMTGIGLAERKILYLILHISEYMNKTGLVNTTGDFANLLAAFRDVFPKYGHHFSPTVKKSIPPKKNLFEKILSFLLGKKEKFTRVKSAEDAEELTKIEKLKTKLKEDPWGDFIFDAEKGSLESKLEKKESVELKNQMQLREHVKNPWDDSFLGGNEFVGKKTYSDRIGEVLRFQKSLANPKSVTHTVESLQRETDAREKVITAYLYNERQEALTLESFGIAPATVMTLHL